MSIGDDKTAPAAPDREPAVVCVTGLGYHWPGTAEAVLRDFSLRLGAGERVFIRGPSGSGKTTLISLIGGLLVPDAGRIALLGRETTALGAAARDRLRADHTGFIFQSFNLVPYLSLVDNVLLACRFSARRRERALQAGPAGTNTGSRRERLEAEALRLLRRLQIPEAVLRRTRVTELSMGQQQRVAAARALIGRPDLVIADEPTSALDADARDGFIELLFEECAAASASLLFVSHDEALAARFDRSIVLAGATPTAAIAGTAARDPAGAGNRC